MVLQEARNATAQTRFSDFDQQVDAGGSATENQIAVEQVLRRSRLRSITLLTALITRQERYVIATAITIRTRNPTNIIVKDENF
ncbi:MAG: hypothetical protein AAFW84_05055 [Cyanobacteria bacterium J06635_15]